MVVESLDKNPNTPPLSRPPSRRLCPKSLRLDGLKRAFGHGVIVSVGTADQASAPSGAIYEPSAFPCRADGTTVRMVDSPLG
jgi:hypothetical protein